MGQVEEQVRQFYDGFTDSDGHAGVAYSALMGEFWHHGEPESEDAGLSPAESAKALERKLIDEVRLPPGGWALDFGSGVGGPTVYMATLREGAHFVGLSNSEWLSQRAREHAAKHNMGKQVSFHTIGDEDYQSLGAWPDNCMDAVLWFESVCHLPDKASFFRSAARILKPGGRLGGIDWVQRPWGEYQSEAQIRRFIEPFQRYIKIPDLGTVDSYRAMIEDAGLVIETAEDLYAGMKCWGSTPAGDAQGWGVYGGEQAELFHGGKRVLDTARDAGVFTVGKFVAVKQD